MKIKTTIKRIASNIKIILTTDMEQTHREARNSRELACTNDLRIDELVSEYEGLDVSALVADEVAELDFEDDITTAVENCLDSHDFSEQIDRAASEYEWSDVIQEAVAEYDFDDVCSEAAKESVSEAVLNHFTDGMFDEPIKQALRDSLLVASDSLS